MVNYYVGADDGADPYRTRGPGGVSIFELQKQTDTFSEAFTFGVPNLSNGGERRQPALI